MTIRIAQKKDLELLVQLDQHISREILRQTLDAGRILIAEDPGTLLGWLRWSLFWDNTPFMNLLYVLEDSRGQGVGKNLVQAWEAQMYQDGFEILMTSTASNEYAQHFYEKLGYQAVGGFTMPGEPYELIFIKERLSGTL